MLSYLRILLYPAMTILISSCAGNSKDKEALKVQNESLEASTRSIYQNTRSLIHTLAQKAHQVQTAERTSIWLPKAEKIAYQSDEIYSYIESFRKEESRQPPLLDIINKLRKYKRDILATDEKINQEFADNLTIISQSIDSLIFKKVEVPSIVIKLMKYNRESMLTTILNNIRLNEYKTTTFCNEQVGMIDDGFFSYSAIIALSSKNVPPGAALEVTAGIGAFSKSSNPTVLINKKTVPLGDAGYSLQQITAPSKPGKYNIPVKIGFISHVTGKEEWIEQNLEYTVTPPCN